MADWKDKMGEAALDLRKHLFGTRYGVPNQPGFVGISPSGIIVYLHCRKRDWKGESPTMWQKYRVSYRYAVGPAITQFDQRIA